MNDERNQRAAHLSVRVSRDLEDKLEMYRELKHHKSLSHTINFFLKLGIKSTELLDVLKENPTTKEIIIKEWESSLKFMISGDILEDEFNKISDNDLETVVMMGYIELVNRKRKMTSKEFCLRENQIYDQVESIFENRIGEKKESE